MSLGMKYSLTRNPLQIVIDHDASAVRTHMFGLRDLIKFRGGFKGLPLPFIKFIYM